MSDKQTSMEFKPYTETKPLAERIAYVKANPSKYKPLAQYRKEQEESKKLDILAGQVQRLIDHFKIQIGRLSPSCFQLGDAQKMSQI